MLVFAWCGHVWPSDKHNNPAAGRSGPVVRFTQPKLSCQILAFAFRLARNTEPNRFHGCCCESCQSAPRLLRPIKVDGGNYGSWNQYADEDSLGQLISTKRAREWC